MTSDSRQASLLSQAGRVSRWLALGAAPAFAVMAVLVWTAVPGMGGMRCPAMPDHALLTGMAPMYALMSLFHMTPWLQLLARRQTTARDGRPRLKHGSTRAQLFSDSATPY